MLVPRQCSMSDRVGSPRKLPCCREIPPHSTLCGWRLSNSPIRPTDLIPALLPPIMFCIISLKSAQGSSFHPEIPHLVPVVCQGRTSRVPLCECGCVSDSMCVCVDRCAQLLLLICCAYTLSFCSLHSTTAIQSRRKTTSQARLALSNSALSTFDSQRQLWWWWLSGEKS